MKRPFLKVLCLLTVLAMPTTAAIAEDAAPPAIEWTFSQPDDAEAPVADSTPVILPEADFAVPQTPDDAANDAEPEVVAAETETFSGFRLWPVILSCAGTFAAGALASFGIMKLVRRRRKPASSPSSAPTNTEILPDFSIRIRGVGNVHNIGKRAYQQDAFGVSSLSDGKLIGEKGVLAVLADGMGGLSNSGEISEAMVRSTLENFRLTPPASQREMLISLISAANRKAANEFMTGAKTGTTFIVASIHDGFLDFVSIGDSRIALVRGDALITLNRPHNYGAELDERAACNIPPRPDIAQKREALTAYLGMRALNMADMPAEPIHLMRGDKIILMSDGIFGTLSNASIVNALKNGASAGGVQLEKDVLACHSEKQDNFTAIILEV